MLPVQALMPKDATLIRRTTTASVAPILNTSRSSRVRNCKSWGFFSSFSSITVSDMLVKTGAKTCQHILMFALLGDPFLLAFNAPWWLWWLWAKDPKHWGQDFRAITGVVAPRQHTDENGKCQHKEDVLNVAPQGIANGHFSTTLPSGRTRKKCRGLVMKSSLICIYLPEKKKGSLWQHLIYIYRKNVGNIREHSGTLTKSYYYRGWFFSFSSFLAVTTEANRFGQEVPTATRVNPRKLFGICQRTLILLEAMQTM